jgi:hypothetical protein
VDADLDTLATALHVKIDELLQAAPQLAPWRPAVGITPKRSHAELVTLAVMHALLGFTSEARWLRYGDHHLRHLFPYLPGQPATTSACVGRQGGSARPSGPSPPTPPCGPTMSGWPTPPGRVRPLSGDRQAFGAGRVGRLRLASQPFALVLGAAPASGLHPPWPAELVRADRRQGRRP